MRAEAIGLLVSAVSLGGCGLAEPSFLSADRTAHARSGQSIAAFDEAVNLAFQLRYAEAAEKFSRVLAGFESAGDRARAAESMFWLGYCYEKMGRVQEAEDTYRRLNAKYPESQGARLGNERLLAMRPAEVWGP